MGFCTKCGFEIIEESSKFCSKCGANVFQKSKIDSNVDSKSNGTTSVSSKSIRKLKFALLFFGYIALYFVVTDYTKNHVGWTGHIVLSIAMIIPIFIILYEAYNGPKRKKTPDAI
jgi:uncharacterized membrane protein YvbJ